MLLGVVVFAVVVTPGGDPISPIVMAGTMYALYEFTIFLLPRRRPTRRDRGRRRRRGRARDEPAVTDGSRQSELATAGGVRRSAGPARRDHHGPLGRRQDGRQQAVRGPRLHGRRQRAQRAAARPRGARRERPGALPTRRARARRALRATRHSPSAPRWARSTAAASSRRSSSSRRATRRSSGASARRATATRSTPSNDGVAVAIARERQMLDEVRAMAQIDHRHLRPVARQLRERIIAALDAQPGPDQLALQVISFGFKYGVPLEADLVFDVRFMENPFYRPELRPPRAATSRSASSCSASRSPQRFLELLHDFFAFAVPAYQAEGKTRLTVAIGCTGGVPSLGRHRGGAGRATCAARTWARCSVWHRELERDVSRPNAPRADSRGCAAGCGRAPASSAGCSSCSWAAAPRARPARSSIRHRVPRRARRQPRWAALRRRQPPVPARARRARCVVLAVGRRRPRLSACWRLLGVLLEPFPARTRAARRAGVPEALARARSAHRRDRRRHRPVDAAARPQAAHAATSRRSSRSPTTAARRASSAQELGIAPVGDIRNCIAALADAEPTMTQPAPVPLPDRARTRPGLARPCLRQPAHRGAVGHRAATSRRASACPTACSRCAARSCRSRRYALTSTPSWRRQQARGPVADHALAGHPPGLDQPRHGRGQRRGGRGHPIARTSS